MSRASLRSDGSPPSVVSDTDADATIDDASAGGAGAGHDDPRLPEGAHLGRYVVLKVVGAGAMGVVYSAYDPELDRTVAVKLLHRRRASTLDGGASQTHADKRLLREAQSLARLTHPNVITVHDVGTVGERVFLAMELVPGGTLTDWLAETRRPWREVLAMFRQAGDGLAAAHAAGLVHHDFKPDNVLVQQGRAVVTDFGLARPVDPRIGGDDADADSDRTPRPSPTVDSAMIVETLTRTGALVGTPAYMAPEQFEGRRGDAASDQFAFCVALFEGLYGERPFPGRDLASLVTAVLEGRMRSPASERGVPRWLRRAIVRGLRLRPAERHADMNALLAELRPPRMSAAARVTAIAGVGLVAGAAMMSATQPDASPSDSGRAAYCDDVPTKLAGVWDDQRRTQLAAAFDASGVGDATAIGSRISTQLDAYASGWVEAQTEACRDGVEGREPQAVADARTACLSRRRSTMGALIDVLVQGDPDAVMSSVEAVPRLPPLSSCRQASATGLPPVPPDAERSVARVRDAMDASTASHILGRTDEALGHAKQAAELSVGVTYPPVGAEAALRLGAMLSAAGQIEPAQQHLHRALAAAAATHHDLVTAEASAELANLELGRLAPMQNIERWVELGLGALSAHEGEHLHLRAGLLNTRAAVQRRSGEFRAAIDTARQVLRLREQHWGADHYSLAEPLTSLGKSLARAGAHEESVAAIERARTILLATYGESHPSYAMVLQNLGSTYIVHGAYTKAHEHWAESHRLLERAMGPSHPAVGLLRSNLGVVLAFIERYDEAMDHATAARDLEIAAYGPQSLAAGSSWALVGEIHLRAGRPDQAREAFERAIAIATATAPGEPGRRANYQSQLGWALRELGQPAAALELLTETLATLETTAGQPSIEWAETAGRVAMVHLSLGELAAARERIDQSVAQYESEDPDPHQHAEARFRRAQILAASERGPDARADAEVALEIYERLGDQPSRTAQVRAWLAANE